MNTNNLIVIAGNQLRHKYFISQLNAHFSLAAVFIENFKHPNPVFKENGDMEIWNQFFTLCRETEEHFLNSAKHFPTQNNPKTVNIPEGLLNHDDTLQTVQSFKPTMIIIFGTSLLGSKYLKIYPRSIFNLHVGLSQYYRGSSCNFWPIYDLRPDLLGATIHYVEKGIDNGKVLNQGTIKLEDNDSEHILMVKTVILGTKLMIESINKPNIYHLTKEKHKNNGKLYLMKQFTPQAILKVKHLVTSGDLRKKIITENKIINNAFKFEKKSRV